MKTMLMLLCHDVPNKEVYIVCKLVSVNIVNCHVLLDASAVRKQKLRENLHMEKSFEGLFNGDWQPSAKSCQKLCSHATSVWQGEPKKMLPTHVVPSKK
jgi:hypothetical protein